jgi:hypothetical protein
MYMGWAIKSSPCTATFNDLYDVCKVGIVDKALGSIRRKPTAHYAQSCKEDIPNSYSHE